MRIIAALAAISGTLILATGEIAFTPAGVPADSEVVHATGELSAPALGEVVEEYCVRCHSDRRLTGNLSLEDFALESAPEAAQVSERIIRKLRAGMMPPSGARRPAGDTLTAFVETFHRLLEGCLAYRKSDVMNRTLFS